LVPMTNTSSAPLVNSLHVPQIQYLLLAIAVGAVVGLVNEYRKITGARIFLGLRTSIFTSMLGFVFAVLYELGGGYLMFVTAFIVITIIAATIYVERARVLKSLGATTYISMLLVFASGMLVGLGLYLYGVVISVIVAVLSFYKTQFLNAISRIRREELLALLNLLLISAVILPLLPDRFIGPYDFFNPFEFWLTVVIVSLIFFAQYVALRVSRRGLLAFTIIGGLVSSTTVTLSIIDLSNRSTKEHQRPLAINVLLSNVPLALVQVGAALYITAESAAPLAYLWLSLTVITLSLAALAIIERERVSPAGLEPPSTPLPFRRILEFATLLFLITAIAKVVSVAAPSYLPLMIGVGALGNALSAVIAVGLLYSRHLISAQAASQLSALSLAVGIVEKAPLSLMSRDSEFRKIVSVGSLVLAAAAILLTAVPL